ncbi:MAG: ferritin family protein [Chloroflexi bacterium]|nr:ferritin family protein [Chloroflexota bacterium]
MDVRKVYEYALQREHEGMKFFSDNAARFGHAAAKGAFEKLAAEEQKHIQFIESLIAGLDSENASVDAGRALEAEGFFSQRADDELLDQTVIEAMVPDLPVLRTAYLIERDFAEFYEMAATRVQDSTAREALGMLARWERGHEKLFKDMHDKAFEEYAGMPWGG